MVFGPVAPQKFTYYFYDLMSGLKLAELPLQGVGFSDQLNGAGSLNASLLLTDDRVKKALAGLGGAAYLGSALSSAKTEVYVDMDGDLMWGGILWTTNYDSASHSVKLGALQHWSYFAQKRRIRWNAAYSGIDQILIFKDIIDTAQAQAGGDIGVVTTGQTPSGVSISVTWDASQLTPVGQACASIAAQSGGRGFDFSIDVYWDETVTPKVPKKQLTLSYPRAGRVSSLTNVVFDMASPWAKPFTFPTDGTAAANVMYGIGAGSGPTTDAGEGGLRSTQAYTPAITDDDYPLLEDSLQRSDITNQLTLDALTIGKLTGTAYPVTLPQVEFALDMPDPLFGSYITGDDVRFIIPKGNEWRPEGVDSIQRIGSWAVSVADEGVSSVKLNLISPEYGF